MVLGTSKRFHEPGLTLAGKKRENPARRQQNLDDIVNAAWTDLSLSATHSHPSVGRSPYKRNRDPSRPG